MIKEVFMKNIIRMFVLFHFLIFVVYSCGGSQLEIDKDTTDISSANEMLLQAAIETGIISVLPDKLFYNPGNTITFSGKITDSKGKAISGVQANIDNPINQMCMLSSKTDKDGKFTFKVTLKPTDGGIYGFAFYYGTIKSFSVISVTPKLGLKIINNNLKINLGVSSIPSSFDISTLIKLPSNSGFSNPNQTQLNQAADQIASSIIETGQATFTNYFSNPANQFMTIGAIVCTGVMAWTGGGLLACAPYYNFVLAELGKSTVVEIAKTTIKKSDKMTEPEKSYWTNAIDRGSCYIAAYQINPATSVLNSISTFGSGWTCGSAIPTIKNGSNNSQYLKIIAQPSSTSSNKSTIGFVFLTSNIAPNKPFSPNPSNGATNITLTPTLSWNATDPNGDILSYDIYFGENTSAPKRVTGQKSTSYNTGTLQTNKKYFWRIVAKDGKGGETTSDWWSFTTSSPNIAPNKPTSPNPPNGATNITLTPTLTWKATDPNGDILSYDIYFGENTSAPKRVTGQKSTSYKYGTLKPNKKYFWRIVAKDGKGGETASDWWSFVCRK